MQRIAILVSSSPTSAQGRRAFRLAAAMADRGHRVALGLLEDATLAGGHAGLGLPIQACDAVLVLSDDLRLRGYEAGDLIPGCTGCTYGELVDLIMEGADQVLGVF